MNLFSPLNLLWLLPLTAGILALWMLRLKRQEVEVPSLFLWRTLLKETQANTPFQRLRRSLLLFLQLLLAFLLIFALARPFVYGKGIGGRAIVIILDTSASMNAGDVGPTRLAQAKQAAADFVDRDMGGSDVAAVLTAGARTEPRLGFSGDKRRLREAIENAPPTDTVADMPGALSLARSLVGTRSGATVRIFSDGAYSKDDAKKLDALPLANADVKFVAVGSPAPDNVAVTAMDGRRNPVTGNYEVFVSVHDLGSRVHDGATLSLLRDGKLIDARALILTGGSQSETFSSPLLKTGGLVTARLDDLQDDLSADNQASLVLPPPCKRRILLVTPGNLFLERGLNLDPDTILRECAPDEFATLGSSGAGYAMVVFDGALPQTPLPPGNYLVFDAVSAQTPLVGTGAVRDGPQFVDQSRADPVMRFVDLDGLNLSRALQTTLAPWGRELAEAESGPLIAAGEHDGRRIVSVAFDLSDSDWPLRVSFPIFLTNAVNFLTAAGGLGPSSPDTPTGGVAALTVSPNVSSLSITRPDGSTSSLAAPKTGGVALFEDTAQAGVYRARGANGYDFPFAVNLLSRDESALATQAHPKLSHAASAPAAPVPLARRARSDLWPYLAAAALFFLLLEWFVFHRRL